MISSRRRSVSLAVAIILVLPWALSRNASASDVTASLDCGGQDKLIVNNTGNSFTALVEIGMRALCQSPSNVNGSRFRESLQTFPTGTTEISFADLGLDLNDCSCQPKKCLAFASLTWAGHAPVDSMYCFENNQGPGSHFDLEDVRTQIEGDVFTFNTIDVNQLDNPPPTCVEPGIAETDTGVVNFSSTTDYQGVISTKFICSELKKEPEACAPTGFGGDGLGRNFIGFFADGDACDGFSVRYGAESPTLPTCCDTSGAAVQCARVVVTEMSTGGATKPVLPPYWRPFNRSVDTAGPQLTYGCWTFAANETHVTPATRFVCDNAPNDADGDETTDDCDNCPGDFNPGQEDCDFDEIGDACDADCFCC